MSLFKVKYQTVLLLLLYHTSETITNLLLHLYLVSTYNYVYKYRLSDGNLFTCLSM